MERILKLMRHALDPSASDGESKLYWEKARQQLRCDNVGVDKFLSNASEPAIETMIVGGEPPEWDVLMPWGKHKGKTLREIYQTDVRYLDWASQNISSPSLRKAIKVILGDA